MELEVGHGVQAATRCRRQENRQRSHAQLHETLPSLLQAAEKLHQAQSAILWKVIISWSRPNVVLKWYRELAGDTNCRRDVKMAI
jgi:hypothetical protein